MDAAWSRSIVTTAVGASQHTHLISIEMYATKTKKTLQQWQELCFQMYYLMEAIPGELCNECIGLDTQLGCENVQYRPRVTDNNVSQNDNSLKNMTVFRAYIL